MDSQFSIHLPDTVTLANEAWDGITDPDLVLTYLARLDNALNSEDPSLVIGASKELIESSGKIVLTELGKSYSRKITLPALVKQVREELKLHHLEVENFDDNSPSTRAAKGINKTLSGAANVVIGLDEFRNAAGTGHGQPYTIHGLGTRHSRLAVDAAKLWCNLIFSTLADENAPWQNYS